MSLKNARSYYVYRLQLQYQKEEITGHTPVLQLYKYMPTNPTKKNLHQIHKISTRRKEENKMGRKVRWRK